MYFNGSWWDVDLTNDANYPDKLYGFKKLSTVTDTDIYYFIAKNC